MRSNANDFDTLHSDRDYVHGPKRPLLGPAYERGPEGYEMRAGVAVHHPGAGPSTGGYFETEQPLKTEKVPSTQGGGVPQRRVASPQKEGRLVDPEAGGLAVSDMLDQDNEGARQRFLQATGPQKSVSAQAVIRESFRRGIAEFRAAYPFGRVVVVPGLADPDAAAQKNPGSVESDSARDFVLAATELGPNAFRSRYLPAMRDAVGDFATVPPRDDRQKGLPPLVGPMDPDAAHEVPAWGARQPVGDSMVRRMQRAEIEREEETLP